MSPYWHAGRPGAGAGGAGVGATVGAGRGVETGVSTGVGIGVGEVVGVGLGLAVGAGEGDPVGVGRGLAVGDGVMLGWLGAGGPPGPPLDGRTATSATADARTMARMVSWVPVPAEEALTIGSAD
jgi:hypothetical protein